MLAATDVNESAACIGDGGTVVARCFKSLRVCRRIHSGDNTGLEKLNKFKENTEIRRNKSLYVTGVDQTKFLHNGSFCWKKVLCVVSIIVNERDHIYQDPHLLAGISSTYGDLK